MLKSHTETIAQNRKRKHNGDEVVQHVDPYPNVSDYAVVTFTNNLRPNDKVLDTRAAAIVRINATMSAPSSPSASASSSSAPLSSSVSSTPVPSRIRLRKSKPIEIDNKDEDLDGETMSDGEVDEALLGPISAFTVSPLASLPSSRRSSVAPIAGPDECEINEYDMENTV